MNPGAANVIAQAFLQGAFQAVEERTGVAMHFDTTEARDASETDLQRALKRSGPRFIARFGEGYGAIVALDKVFDAEVAPEVLSADLAETFFHGGVALLANKTGQDWALLEVRAGAGADDSGELWNYLAEPVGLAIFSYQTEGGKEGAGSLFYQQDIEEFVPQELIEAVFGSAIAPPASRASDPLVSDAEMSDILSNFTDEDAGAEVQAPEVHGRGRHQPENLDVILDIELTATARLGRVEMPIADILKLGPGAIIEVGQLVDEPIELLVNNKLVARGDVVVVDEKFGLRITEVVSRAQRLETLR
ncbi:MAG: flagellar motor switch protein FliN [Candidatus Hydrogenedentales bacterium]